MSQEIGRLARAGMPHDQHGDPSMNLEQMRLMAGFYLKALPMMKILGPVNGRINPVYNRDR